MLDEAQFVKNRQAKTHVAVRRLGAPFTVAVTGTPLENSLMDLWSLLSLTAPGLYPRPDVFTKNYRKPIESGERPELLDLLRRRIRPLMLRRTKEQVAIDLPPKQIQVMALDPHPVHRHIYDQHLQRERQRVLGLLDDPESNRVAILAALTRLRQLALDPVLVDEVHAGKATAAKIEFLVDQLRELAAEGHRALVFSQFTGFLRIVEAALTRAGLDDGIPRRVDDRPAGRRRGFREGDAVGVPHQPQGRRVRADAHRGRLRLRPRPVVEPCRRGAGHRPGPPHRAEPPGHRLPARLGGHHRGEGRRAAGAQARPLPARRRRGRLALRRDHGRRRARPARTRVRRMAQRVAAEVDNRAVTQNPTLDELAAQESTLVFDRFDDDTAWAVGVALRDAARAAGTARGDLDPTQRPATLPRGPARATADNDGWLERKSAVVDRYGHSSLYVGEEFRAAGKTFEDSSRLDPSRYAAHGGAFPVIVRGVGCVGTIAVSGLPQREDHRLVVETLEAFLGATTPEPPPI